jgi:hypothetical protein
MKKLLSGRNLVNAIGVPSWLFLIWKGDIFYATFILIVVVLALGEFYNLSIKKRFKTLKMDWYGLFCFYC